jgi:superfamily II DNA or RNA helicase
MKNFTNDDDKIKILLNVNILKEGINLPCADMIVFIETKIS